MLTVAHSAHIVWWPFPIGRDIDDDNFPRLFDPLRFHPALARTFAVSKLAAGKVVCLATLPALKRG